MVHDRRTNAGGDETGEKKQFTNFLLTSLFEPLTMGKLSTLPDYPALMLLLSEGFAGFSLCVIVLGTWIFAIF